MAKKLLEIVNLLHDADPKWIKRLESMDTDRAVVTLLNLNNVPELPEDVEKANNNFTMGNLWIGKPRIDFNSQTWHGIEELITTKIEKLRKMNDLSSLDAVQTALLRGQIAALKELAAMPDKIKAGENRPKPAATWNSAGKGE